MEVKSINSLASKLYANVQSDVISNIADLFSKDTTFSSTLKYDPLKEYLKKMIISQVDIDRILLSHKYLNADFSRIPEFKIEADKIRKQITSDFNLSLDENTIKSLFSNSLGISSDEESDKWKEVLSLFTSNGQVLESIYFEEEFKYYYNICRNPIMKFIKSFKYKRLTRENTLEDSYMKKIREILQAGFKDNPDNLIYSYVNCRRLLERGLSDYESLKTLGNISQMTLLSLTQQPDSMINIQDTCNTYRLQMQDVTGLHHDKTKYRNTLVSPSPKTSIKFSIRNIPVMQGLPAEQIPQAIQNLQAKYEEAYTKEQSPEDYIKDIVKIYTNFISIQPYEDGNKRTATCVFNSMLLSKGIVPPPVSLVNDDSVLQAFYKVKDNDYTMLQDIIIERYKHTLSSLDANSMENTHKATPNVIDIDPNIEQ